MDGTISTGAKTPPSSSKRSRQIPTRAAILAALLAALLLSGAYQLRPYLNGKSQLRGLLAREASLDREIAKLEAAKQRLATNGEVERLAREQLGMVRPGETAFVVPPEPAAAAAVEQPAFPGAGSESRRAWYARVWHWLVDVPGASSAH
jgi:cell division protein FtsB